MKVLVQTLRDGAKEIVEIPHVELGDGEVRVKVKYSAISLGTELSTIKAAQASLFGKLRARPDQAKNVVNAIQKHGLRYALNAVDKKLGALSPLGYSTCGEITEVGNRVSEFRVGDFVACGGIGAAIHATHNIVPVNQVVALDPGADPGISSLNSLGAIILEAFRLTEFSPGVKVCIMGYGLLGQLAATIAESSGADVIVLDNNSNLHARAETLDHKFIPVTTIDETSKKISAMPTWQHGADIVLICASTQSNQPINLAGAITRQRGQVVIVGDVGTEFKRDPDFYRKEITLSVSCSYGAGRYDPKYEMEGLDYPYGLVRWTSKRNMEAFQQIILRNKEKYRKLIVRETPFSSLVDTYADLEKNGSDGFVIVKYPGEENNLNTRSTSNSEGPLVTAKSRSEKFKIGLFGPGAYAQGTILPILKKNRAVVFSNVASKAGLSALRVKRKYGFDKISGSAEEIFKDPAIDYIFCTPRHDLHAWCVKLAIQHNKKIFIEKPLCIDDLELAELKRLHAKGKVGSGQVTLGFNRSFSPIYQKFKQMAKGSRYLHYQVNAGHLPKDAWQLGPSGGGRVIGEVCHFIELCCNFFDSSVMSLHACCIDGQHGGLEDWLITLNFKIGATATIHYHASGYNGASKEIISARNQSATWLMDDYKKILKNGKKVYGQWSVDKGQKAMLENLLTQDNYSSAISDFAYLLHITDVSFAIEKSRSVQNVICI